MSNVLAAVVVLVILVNLCECLILNRFLYFSLRGGSRGKGCWRNSSISWRVPMAGSAQTRWKGHLWSNRRRPRPSHHRYTLRSRVREQKFN